MLYLGLPLKTMSQKLQMVQNTVASVFICSLALEAHCIYAGDLQWLRRSFQVYFKVAIFHYKIFHSLAPGYLQESNWQILPFSGNALNLGSALRMSFIKAVRTVLVRCSITRTEYSLVIKTSFFMVVKILSTQGLEV